MKITQIIQSHSPSVPFYTLEFFPPKTSQGLSNLLPRLRRLSTLSPNPPAWIHVTWGAGGSTRERSLELAEWIRKEITLGGRDENGEGEDGGKIGPEVCLHLTCTNLVDGELDETLDKIKAIGIQNILALRGDPPRGSDSWVPTDPKYQHAIDLVNHIRNRKDADWWCVGVAGYPESHLESLPHPSSPTLPPTPLPSFNSTSSSPSYPNPNDSNDPANEDPVLSTAIDQDLKYLILKIKSGADFVVTQLFYDTHGYLDWEKKVGDRLAKEEEGKKFRIGLLSTGGKDDGDAKVKGIPVIPGVMPIMGYASWRRITRLAKVRVPKSVEERLEPIRANDSAVKDYGVELAIQMLQEMTKAPVPSSSSSSSPLRGFHLCTLNLERSITRVLEGLEWATATANSTEKQEQKQLPIAVGKMEAGMVGEGAGGARREDEVNQPISNSPSSQRPNPFSDPHPSIDVSVSSPTNAGPSSPSGRLGHPHQPVSPMEANENAIAQHALHHPTHQHPPPPSGSSEGQSLTTTAKQAVQSVASSIGFTTTSQHQQGRPSSSSSSREKEDFDNRDLDPRQEGSLKTSWDEFPNGRFGDPRSPAYGEMDGWGVGLKMTRKEALRLWDYPLTPNDISNIFLRFICRHIRAIPWSDEPVAPETSSIAQYLSQMILKRNWWTVGSQPAFDSVPSTDPTIGFGPKGGWVYQKAFVEFFLTLDELENLERRIEKLAAEGPESGGNERGCLKFFAANRGDGWKTNMERDEVNSVTWGVFGGKEIVTTTMIEEMSFKAWKEEAFELWKEWELLYRSNSPSRKLLKEIGDTRWLISIVHHNFKEPGALWEFLLEES